jgi:1-acyl-sn-glycerol-3-phosphate acyltransferase
MLEAHKGGLGTWAVERYLRWKLRGAFRGLWVRGTLPAAEQGLVVYANHSNWWDGFVAAALGQAAGWDGYCLVEEKNLRRYRFLTRLRAFSIHPGRASSALASLRYARRLLERPRAAVFVFPEGELRPFGRLPLKLAGGVEVLARAAQVPCLPVAIRYAFFEDEKPDVLLEVGPAHPAAAPEVLAERLGEAVARLARASSPEGFQQLLAGRSGVAQRWDRVRGLGPGGAG